MSRLIVVLTAFVFALPACGAGHKHEAAVAAPTPTLRTEGVAPVPTQVPQSVLGQAEAEHYKTLASRARPCKYAQAQNTINDKLYIGCQDGNIVVLDALGHLLASANVPMYGVSAILPAGQNAIAVLGWNDGAALRSELSILRATTLRPIVRHFMSDSTFLGVIGNRAYIDDWCCNGRPDVYQPATIYSISLTDGSESEPVDLAPDPQAHPGNLQPLGQGEHNYIIGNYLYVVVGPMTYRYDVGYLERPPKRMATPGTASR